MGSHSRLRQLAEQSHQLADGLLELIGATQIALLQDLLDLPVQPQGGLIEQGSVITGAVILQELVGVLAGRKVQDPQFQLSLHRQLLDLADRTIRRPDAGSVGIEIEHDPLAVADAAELRDLLVAQGRPQSCHRIVDPGGMEGDHIEIALHDHSTVIPADGIGRLVQSEQVLAFFEQLRLRRVQILRFTAVQAATTESDHPTLAIVDRHHHPMAEPVVEPIATLTGHHEAGSLQQLWCQTLHLLQMAEQAIPLIRGIAELKRVLRRRGQSPLRREIRHGLLASRALELRSKPTGSQGNSPLKLLTTGQLLTQTLLLRPLNGLHRQLIFASQLQHHVTEALALELHQKLDGVPTRTAGEAVIELLLR